MIRLPAGLPFQRCPRLVAYAILAALITTLLLTADGAYRWYHDASTQVAEPATPARPVEAAEPAPAETQHADSPSQAPAPMPEREVVGIAEQTEGRPDAGPVPNPTSGSIPNPPAVPNSRTASGAVADEAAPQRTQPKSLQQPKRHVRGLPAKQAAPDRTTPRRPVQAASRPAQAEKPNVYWERDSQLGFAAQLRKRTCNPATGNMPMQCYYPREGRQNFPAKPLN